MTQEAIERRGDMSRFTLNIDSTDLVLGHELALLVDGLRLGPRVDVTLQRHPTPDDKTTGHLSVNGTTEQLDVFKRALGVYRESVAAKLSGRALDAEMTNFFALQAIRYGITS
jgi:hypothetical protein